MAAKRLGKLAVKNSCLFLCDMQEKFRPTIQYFPQIVSVSARMLQAARLLEMPVVVTEQYPKGQIEMEEKRWHLKIILQCAFSDFAVCSLIPKT